MNVKVKNYLIDLISKYAEAARLEGAGYVTDSKTSERYQKYYKEMKEAQTNLQNFIESL